MADAAHSFRFSAGAGVAAVGSAGAVPDALGRALDQGGDAVLQVFERDLQALQALRRAAAVPADLWLSGTDEQTGLPVRYVEVGNDFLAIGLIVPPEYRAKLIAGSGSIDNYVTVGFYYVTLTVGSGQDPADPQQVTQVMTGTVDYAGDGLATFSGDTAFGELMELIVGKSTDFVAATVGQLLEVEAGDLEAAGGKVDNAVSKSASRAGGIEMVADETGVETAFQFAIEASTAAETVLQLVGLALLLPLALLAKQLTGYVRVYNATPLEIDTSLAWVAEGNQAAGAEVATAVALPPHGRTWTPPSIIGAQATPYLNWVVGNTDVDSEAGYVLKLSAVDDFPGADIMVAIPNHGADSLAVSFGEDDEAEDFWNAHLGQNTGLTASAIQGPYRIRVATNQVTGRSPAPADGSLSYSYEHLVLIDKS